MLFLGKIGWSPDYDCIQDQLTMIIQFWIVKHQTSSRKFLILNEFRYFCYGQWQIVSKKKNSRQRNIFLSMLKADSKCYAMFFSVFYLSVHNKKEPRTWKETLEIVSDILHSEIFNRTMYVVPLFWHVII